MKGRTQWILFGVALAMLMALSVWWTVLIHQSIEKQRDLSLQVIQLQVDLSSAELESRRDQVEEHHRRRLIMVMGEGGLLFVLVGVCILMLLRLVQQEHREIRAITRFIGAVSHEMKTPLAGIKTLLQTMNAGKVPRERREELVRMGLRESERLEHMIENVLISGRLRTDRQELELSVVRVGELMESFLEHRRETLVDPSVLTLDMESPVEDEQVLVDPDSMRVVLENLVDNGLKYGGEDPRIRIRAQKEDDGVLLEVQDEGQGFDPADADRLFVPFRRALDMEKGARHGTGLGLSIARALVRRMGGDLTAHSQGSGQGSTFRVRLPGRPR